MALLGGAVALTLDAASTTSHPPVVVLFTRGDRGLSMSCPAGRCVRLAIEDLTDCPSPRRVRGVNTVVVFGHSYAGDHWLGHPLASWGRALACFPRVRLVVMNTCFGAATEALDELHRRGLHPVVVGSPSRLPRRGLMIDPAFFSAPEALDRIASLHAPPSHTLSTLRWSAGESAGMEARIAAWPLHERRRRLVSRVPHLLRVPYGAGEAVATVSPAVVGE